MSLKDIPRPTLLKIVAGAVIGLWLLDNFIIEPAFHAWGEQSERIEALQKKVERGRSLLARESNVRGRWAEMQRNNLPDNDSLAEGDVINAMARWRADSGISISGVALSRQPHDDLGYDTFEYRATATGGQVSLGRFIYELETDPIPVNLEECELATRDVHGQQLTLTARYSFARLAADMHPGNNNGGAPGGNAR